MLLAAALMLIATPASARIDPHAFADLSFHEHPGSQLPLSAEFRDQAGRPVALGDALGGRPAVLVLEYLRCQNLCSLVLSGAANAISRGGLAPGRDVNLVAISIDPRDTSSDVAAAQAMYSRRFPDPLAAAHGIRFLTGSPDQVGRVAAAIGFPYRLDKESGQFAHPTGFVVATPAGKISRYMLGLNPSSAALRQAVAEAAADKIEPPAHPLLLLCFGYDPDEGTAAALAMRLVRWASLAAVAGCALLIGFLSLKRRSA
jgi:protein SCO1/2